VNRFRTGLVVGKFHPLHRGHQLVIQTALAACDHVFVVMTALPGDHPPGPVRLGWIRELYPRVTAILLPGSTPNYPNECKGLEEFYAVWKALLLEHCGLIPDAIFTSEDYGDECERFWGTKHVCVDKRRAQFTITGTAVRADPFAHWDDLDPVVRTSYVKTVCLYGPESTGKSTLGQKLAAHYGTVCQPEWARDYLGERHCEFQDMQIIANGHFAARQEFKRLANKVLFVDTDTLITRSFSQHYYGRCPRRVEELIKHPDNQNDLYLFTSIDVPWVADTSRDLGTPELRMKMQQDLLAALVAHGARYIRIEGSDWDERFAQAVAAVNRHIFQQPSS
jgi:HTH-type transcriptional repressor of NAD biosynthesis genes